MPEVYGQGSPCYCVGSPCSTANEPRETCVVWLKDSPPREIRCDLPEAVIHVWTDGSLEAGRSGIGAVCYDCLTGRALVCEGQVPDCIMQRWAHDVGEHRICQIELYAYVCIRWMCKDWFANRRVIYWLDNDAARAVIIKGTSGSLTMHRMAMCIATIEMRAPSFGWVERVPSCSNISDGPSRGESDEACELVGVSTPTTFEEIGELLAALAET